MRSTALSAYDMSTEEMRRFATAVRKTRLSCLYGYVSALEKFARFLREEDLETAAHESLSHDRLKQ